MTERIEYWLLAFGVILVITSYNIGQMNRRIKKLEDNTEATKK